MRSIQRRARIDILLRAVVLREQKLKAWENELLKIAQRLLADKGSWK